MRNATDQTARTSLRPTFRNLAAPLAVLGLAAAAAAQSPWAVEVVSYDEGATATPGFTNPQVALGSPERFTGESAFPSVVSPFSPPYEADEIVSIGEGGHLTLRFEMGIRNDAANPFGVDLILFGNGGFFDSDFPNGVVGDPPGTFGLDRAELSISADGIGFVSLGEITEGFFPAMGYVDSGPFDTEPGAAPTDFRLPVDPSLTLDDFAGADYDTLRALYAGSGGGAPIDIAPSGLEEAFYVRLSLADDGDPDTFLSVEVDAFSVVPAPATGALSLLCLSAAGLRRRRSMRGSTLFGPRGAGSG